MEYGSRYPFWPKARPWEFPWKRNLRHVRVSGGGDRVSGLGSMLYGTTLRGHVPSDLAFRSHLGSSLELSCLPELGAVFFSMSSDSGQEKLLKMYNISCRYNGPFRHWKVVPGYVYDIVYAHTNSAASQEQLAERPNNNPIVDGRTELEHYLDNHEMKGFYERWDETGLALRILLAPSLQEPPTTISVMHGNWLGITEPVDEDPTSSHKEEDDTEVAAYWKARRDKEEADIMANFNERAMTIALGWFPPGSYPAQQQRLYENLPKQLKDAYRKEANGHGPMSSDEKNAYDHLAQIFSQMEATNTWIEMCMERRPGKKRDRDFVAWHAQLADQMKEWEDFAKEPVKVLGSVS